MFSGLIDKISLYGILDRLKLRFRSDTNICVEAPLIDSRVTSCTRLFLSSLASNRLEPGQLSPDVARLAVIRMGDRIDSWLVIVRLWLFLAGQLIACFHLHKDQLQKVVVLEIRLKSQ